MADREEKIVVSNGGGAAGWFVAIFLVLVVAGGLYYFGDELMGNDADLEISVDVPEVTEGQSE